MKITERNGEKRRKLNEIIVRNDRRDILLSIEFYYVTIGTKE